jgi:hypothetical protein
VDAPETGSEIFYPGYARDAWLAWSRLTVYREMEISNSEKL